MYALQIALYVLLSVVSFDPSSTQKRDRNPDSNRQQYESVSTSNSFGANTSGQQYEIQVAQQQYDAYSDCLYRAYLWATIIGVVGGFVGIFFLIQQTIATKHAAEAALRNSEAIITAERAQIVCKWKKDTDTLFSLGIYNCGRTPARLVDFKFFSKIKQTGEDLPDTPDYGLHTQFEQERILCAGDNWHPQDFLVTTDVRDIGDDWFKGIHENQLRRWIYGRVQYRDVFKPEPMHETGFCFFYSPIRDEFIVGGPSEYTKFT
jgi:hypothetical protein